MVKSYLSKRRSIIALSQEIKNGNLKPTELVEYYLKAIEKLNPKEEFIEAPFMVYHFLSKILLLLGMYD